VAYIIECRNVFSKEIADEINDHLKNFGKEAIDVDYNGNGQCPFCNSRIDEFDFCACGGNLGVD
jgi:hypothetical protein